MKLKLKAILAALVMLAGVLVIPASAQAHPNRDWWQSQQHAAAIAGEAPFWSVHWDTYFHNANPSMPTVYYVNSTSGWYHGNKAETWFVFQSDCNFVAYYYHTAVWASNTNLSTTLRPCRLSWERNADVSVRDKNGTIRWHTNQLWGNSATATFAMYNVGECLQQFKSLSVVWRNRSFCEGAFG